ncbi:MAG TPA: hypothetical protein VF230_15660 [Acidimicrobiales bacterium]
MKDINIVGMEPGVFGVQVTEAQGVETSHRVTVPDDFGIEIGVPELDLELLVRETFAFLLEREPATSILQEFSLDEIDRYFPDYREEIAARVTAQAG